MKRTPLVLLGLLSLAASAPPQQEAEPAPLGYVLEARGTVRLRRATFSRTVPAGVASELRRGDLVELGGAAEALLLCPDLLTVWRPLPAATSGVFQDCPRPAEKLLRRLDQQTAHSRGLEGPITAVAPSNTALLDPTPLLRWSSEHEQTVRVSLFDGRDPRRAIWGPVRTKETAMLYPGRPSLEPEVPYFLRVEPATAGGWAADGRPFVVLPESERIQVTGRLHEIEQRLPPGSARDLANAIYLLARELRRNAFDLLETLPAPDQSAPLLLLRARVAGSVAADADDLLRSALEAARRQHDDETEAEALVSLGHSALKRDEAARLLRQAAARFRALGDTDRARQLERESP